jgi:hypothetical protein
MSNAPRALEGPFLSRELRNKWDWYRVTPRERMLDPAYIRLDAATMGVLERMTWVAWEQGWLPSEVDDIAFLTRFSTDEVAAALPKLQEAGFVRPLRDRPGFWLPRSEEHMAQLIGEQEVKSERARRAARSSVAARRGSATDDGNDQFEQSGR